MRKRRGLGSVGSSGSTREKRFKVSEQERGRMAAERARAHLARAQSELEAAQRFVEPGAGGETELALGGALANARASVAEAIETVRKTLGEQDARNEDGPSL
jgi:methylmalonyl-CoA mutase N-terminal domain/subunit